MEKMEFNNALIIESDFFDERVLNNFAISANFGVLGNDVGTGKTRIAVAMAFRNLYSQQRSTTPVLRKLPITTYHEVIKQNDGDKQLFKQFFGAKELRYNPISEVNVNKLGNDLEKGIRYKCIDATLMVVSPSTFHQWKSEVLDMENKFDIKGKKYLFISSEEDFSTPDPIDDPEYAEKVNRVKQNLKDIDSNENTIIVMTNKWYNDSLTSSSYFFSFNRIFFDEPDTIEYKTSNKITSRFTWLVSATAKQWMLDRYNTIKGDEKLAGRDKATRVGETEICTYDDPSVVEIILNNFVIRDSSSPVDNSELLEFVKYPVFSDNFYNAFGQVLADYSSLTEALSAYYIEALEKILGTEKICVMDKIYKFIESNYATKSEVNALDLKFGEQTSFAKGQQAGSKYSITSDGYKALKDTYTEKRKEMCESIEKREGIFKEIDKILIESTKGAKCTICKETIADFNVCNVSDCCFGIMHNVCIEKVKADARAADESSGRRRRRRKQAEPEKKEEEEKPVEAVAVAVGSANNSLFKDIIYSSGKVFKAGTSVAHFDETITKGNKVSTKGLFDIDRVVEQEEYSAFEDMFSEKEAERFDCRCCGVVAAKIYPLEKSFVIDRLVPGKEQEQKDAIVTRQEKIVDMLKSRTKDQRFLIYSTNGSNITSKLGDGIPFRIVTGNALERERAIVEYRRGDIDVLVLLDHENAAGLNLTETTDLVIFNQTSDVIAEQVIGRVDRLGLKHSVKIHLFDTNRNMLNFIEKKYKK